MPLPTTPYILSTNAWEFITAADYPAMRDFIGIGPTDTLSLANLNTTSASLSASTPFTIDQTWNNAAIAFNALTVKATNTNSAAASKLLDLQVGPNSLFSVRKDGAIIGTNTNTIFAGGTGSFFPGRVHVGDYNFSVGSNVLVQIAIEVDGSDSANAVILNKDAGIYWSSLASANNIITLRSSTDLALRRDGAANTLALRNDDFAQTFNMYGTYSSAGANYARLAFSCAANGNATISTQASGTGVAGTVSINGVPVGRGRIAGNISIGGGLNASTISGTDNISLGNGALANITVATQCIGIGTNALGTQTIWGANIAIGYEALFLSSNGAINNTAIGIGALYHNGSGSNSIAVGLAAGRQTSIGNNTGTVNNSVFLGNFTKALNAGETNQIVIGHEAQGIGSNSVVLGNDSITKTALKGNVGIGTTAPSEKLHVLGGKVLFGDATDVTGTAGNGDLTLRAYRSPQIHISANTSSSVLYGLNIELNNNIYAGLLLNLNSGEVKIGGLSVGGYFPTFYSDNVERMRITAPGNVGIGTTAPTSNLTVTQPTAGIGTISVGAGLTTVTGVNTQFLNTFKVGDTITSAGQTLTISAIASNTSMSTSAAGAAIAGQPYTLVGGTRFTVAGNGKVGIGENVFLERDGDNFLALRNGASAQTFNIYSSYSDASNYSRLSLGPLTGGGDYYVIADNLGTGTARGLNLRVGTGRSVYMSVGLTDIFRFSAAGLTFLTDNTYDIGASGATRPRNLYIANSITTGSVMPNSGSDLIFNGANTGAAWKISTTGHFLAFTDNTYDIGASGATRPRNVFVADSVFVGTTNVIALGSPDGGILNWNNRANIMSPSTAIIRLVDNPRTNFNLLQFGGAAGFPGLKRVGSELQVVAASTTSAMNVAAVDADLTFIEDRYRRKGTGDPNGVVTAPVGAVYHRTDGGANTSFYVKETGTDSNGWVGK